MPRSTAASIRVLIPPTASRRQKNGICLTSDVPDTFVRRESIPAPAR
jgi:hypothetical protein